MKNLLLFISIVWFFESCKSTYGIKSTKIVNEENIKIISAFYKIKQSYIVDKRSYIDFLKTLSKDSLFIKNHTQPLQAIYFGENGKMISYHINCNAGGFPNLVWNKNNLLETFPPKTQTKVDTLFILNKFMEYLKIKNSIETKQYVFLFWNDCLGRQTKRFLDQFRANLEKPFVDKNIQIIYINNDNLYVN